MGMLFMRKCLPLLLVYTLFVSTALCGGVVIEEAIVQEEKSEAIYSCPEYTVFRMIPDPAKGFYWPYLLRIETGLADDPTILCVECVNTGRPTNSYRFHEESALWEIQRGYRYDEKFRSTMVQIMPVILRPRDDYLIYTHDLDRDSLTTDKEKFRRIDLQVIAMIDDCREFLAAEYGYGVGEKVVFRGFSASGSFAQRMSVLHPERTRFVVAGGFGGEFLLPVSELNGRSLRFPIGVGDYEELLGKPFSMEAYRAVPRFLHLGDQDTNDATLYNDAYDLEDKELIHFLLGASVQERWRACIRILSQYDTLNEYHDDPGMGHRISDEMHAKIEAFVERELR